MKIALAQVQFFLGDFEKNCSLVLEILKKTKGKVDLLLFPEGGLWGYPPKDFLYQNEYFEIQKKKLEIIKKESPPGIGVLLPGFLKNKDKMQNGAFLIQKNKKNLFFAKEFLADKGVFFESRYFEKGKLGKNTFSWKKKKIQVLICEDLWHFKPQEKADLLIALNASPWTDEKQNNRLKRMQKLGKSMNCPSLYLNGVGAQDSLIFDGGSFVLNSKGERIWQGEFFKPDFHIMEVFSKEKKKERKKIKDFLNIQEQRRQALILGLRNFVVQSGFSKAHLGLSGGMDSALVAYLAVQALGKKNVKAYFLPSLHTQDISYKIVKELVKSLGIELVEKDIRPLMKDFSKFLFDKKSPKNKITLQNLQARIRALILMAKANESSSLLLATGNKSELATGYSTLYGDLAGALCPIGDLLKTEVYELAHFINKKEKLFSKALLERAPSAELAPGQKDQDDLPPYKELDLSLQKILEEGPLVDKEKELARMISRQEFKRFQAPPILKLSERDLGESWRKPLAHNFPI